MITDHKRNMTDDMLKLIAKNRGVVQLTMISDYLREALPNTQLDSAMAIHRANMKPLEEMTQEDREDYRTEIDEINKKYPIKEANVKHVVDHIDHIVKVAGIDHVGIGCDFDGGGGIEGIFDVSEVMNITIELVKRGNSDEQIQKIWRVNIMRV